MNRLNVLVTGSGSLYGVAVIQSLLKSDLDLKVVAVDIDARTLGLHLAHRGYIFPPVRQEELYFKRLRRVMAKEKIHGVFVASSRELSFFSSRKAELEETTGARVFTNSTEVLKICLDKWKTVQFLKEQGFDHPRTLRYPEDRDQIGRFVRELKFPIVVKPRRGKGSEGCCVAKDYSMLRSLTTGKENLVLQQYLPDAGGEFTTGVCCGAGGRVLSGITLKRTLQDGMTMAAESGDFSEITGYCKRVAAVLKPYGPCNFQSRLLEGKPHLFEINPRFSSSTGMRCLLGVKEAEIILRSEILGEEIAEPEIIRSSVIRQYADYLVPTGQILKLEQENYYNNIRQQFDNKKSEEVIR